MAFVNAPNKEEFNGSQYCKVTEQIPPKKKKTFFNLMLCHSPRKTYRL